MRSCASSFTSLTRHHYIQTHLAVVGSIIKHAPLDAAMTALDADAALTTMYTLGYLLMTVLAAPSKSFSNVVISTFEGY